MSKPQRLASFCRLCLSKTKDKVPVFSEDNLLDGLLQLVEIKIDRKDESDAIVCYDCVVTLEGFHQFKEQCHVNDEFVKSLPPKIEENEDSDGENVEEDEEEDEPGRYDDDIDEIDHLEPSEDDERLLQEAQSKKRLTKSSPKKNLKDSSPKAAKKTIKVEVKLSPPMAKATTSKAKESPSVLVVGVPEAKKSSNLLEIPKLAESYPDYFYFEKGARSVHYTLVFYGERYNSALFHDRNTYWQCAYRRKYQCPAQVWASNDYQKFERHYEHTHLPQPALEGKIFTPEEALPDLFQITYNILKRRRERAQQLKAIKEVDSKEVDFKEEQNPKRQWEEEDDIIEEENDIEESPIASDNNFTDDEELEEGEVVFSKQPPRKKQKHTVELDLEPVTYKDLDRIEAECAALNVPKRPLTGPKLEELQVLADEYPDFFYFEKGPRNIYYTLVFYGERFHSALFTEHYTYWQCHHKRKYKCPAVVAVTNDYKTFERRYEHTHGEIKMREGIIYTPKEALPQIFDACRKVVYTNRARRRQKLLMKYKYLKALNEETKPVEFVEADDDLQDVSGGSDVLTRLMTKSEIYVDEEMLDDDDED